MAAESHQPSLNPAALSAERRSTSSYGRGGAGNINASTNKAASGAAAAGGASEPASDLTTPTIKAPTYTTGRGGSGNMATNDASQPELARAAQDVEAPPSMAARDRDGLPGGTYHWGRGGEGNMVTVAGRRAAGGGRAGEDAGAEGARNASKERKKIGGGAAEEPRRGSFRDAVVQRGREMLGFGKGKAEEGGVEKPRVEAGEESAVEDA